MSLQNFNKITPFEINENVFKLIEKDWMLVTAGDKNKYNTMTASWGGLGILWNKPVSFVFIRPQRYTYQFIEENSHYSLSFFDDKYRDVLNLCGTKSGKDIDKMNIENLSALELNNGIAFNEAKLIVECKKVYFNDILPENFLNDKINTFYKQDYHRLYIGEIENCYIKK